MTQNREVESVASPFEDELALVKFQTDLAAGQGEDYIPEFAEVCGRCLYVVSVLGVCGCARRLVA